MDLESAKRITAARREIAEAETTPPDETGHEDLSPSDRLHALRWRIEDLGKKQDKTFDSYYNSDTGVRKVTTSIKAEDESELKVVMQVWLSEQGAGGLNALHITAQWFGDGEPIGDRNHVTNGVYGGKNSVNETHPSIQAEVLESLVALEEAVAAAEFMVETAGSAGALQTA